jgi:hypothetical protein
MACTAGQTLLPIDTSLKSLQKAEIDRKMEMKICSLVRKAMTTPGGRCVDWR